MSREKAVTTGLDEADGVEVDTSTSHRARGCADDSHTCWRVHCGEYGKEKATTMSVRRLQWIWTLTISTSVK